MNFPEPPDWEEICERYPHAGLLGAPDSTSIRPAHWPTRILIGFAVVAVAVLLFIHY
jgi:hypothetical protein